MNVTQTNVTQLRCTVCDSTFSATEIEYTCPHCGIWGILDVEYDYEAIGKKVNRASLRASREFSLWRYAPLLPLPEYCRKPKLRVGWTPVYETPRLARELGVRAAWVKDDGLSPTGSAKDRASAVGTARAICLGREVVACASTGNAACSLAGMCADLGLHARIFVPAAAPQAKVAQLVIFGADVVLVDAPYDVVWKLCQSAVERFGWYNRNCAVNPYLIEGKKTSGLEIGEQMADELPDVVAVAVGDGCTIAGVGKGLAEMHRLGIIDRIPRLLGVQAAGAAPIARAFERNVEELDPVNASTIADSISVGTPRNWRKALRAVKSTGGTFVTVSDEQIIDMIPRLARASGVFAEPTAVAAAAGVLEARHAQRIAADERVLVVVTGNGLKDVPGAMRSVRAPDPISAEINELERVIV